MRQSELTMWRCVNCTIMIWNRPLLIPSVVWLPMKFLYSVFKYFEPLVWWAGKLFSTNILHNYPWIFPLVGHRDDVHVEEVQPLKVASLEPGRWGWRLSAVTFEPLLDDVVVELFTPQQARVGLSRHLSLLLVSHWNFLKFIFDYLKISSKFVIF